MEFMIIMILGAIGGFAVFKFLIWCLSKIKHRSFEDRVTEAVVVALDEIDKKKKEKIKSLKKK